jgi:hypothetical protein
VDARFCSGRCRVAAHRAAAGWGLAGRGFDRSGPAIAEISPQERPMP